MDLPSFEPIIKFDLAYQISEFKENKATSKAKNLPKNPRNFKHKFKRKWALS